MEETNTAIEIRPARREDADDIAAMARALSISDGDRISRFSAKAFLRDGFGDNPAFDTMVATKGGVSAGYAVYYWGYDTDSATRGVYLADLYVTNAIGAMALEPPWSRGRAIAEMLAGAGYFGRCSNATRPRRSIVISHRQRRAGMRRIQQFDRIAGKPSNQTSRFTFSGCPG